MNVRFSALACLLMLTAPAALDLVEVPLGPFSVREAHAQDQVTELAREKFKEGVTAFDTGKYEQARTAFLQAYALKRHPAVLLNLGQSEIKAGYPEDGGNHLQQFLRQHKQATEGQKAAARAGIQDAQKKTAFTVVIIDANKARVAIDGKAVGESPLLDPYFVTPGKHLVAATYKGKTLQETVDAKRGTATPVSINFGVATTPAPVPVPTPTPTGANPAPPPAYPPPPPTGEPSPMPGPPMGSGPGDTGTGRENFFHWYPHKPLAWVGTGLTGVGLIGTIVFAAVAGDANGKANDFTDAIQKEEDAKNNVPEGRKPCGPEDRPEFDLPHYADACAELRDHLARYDGALIGVGVFVGVTVLAAGGTVLYYFLDTADGDSGFSSLRLEPIIGPETQGFGLTGTF